MAAATAYVVSPIDVVPEAFLLVFGLVDDAVDDHLAGRHRARRDRAVPGVGEGAGTRRRSLRRALLRQRRRHHRQHTPGTAPQRHRRHRRHRARQGRVLQPRRIGQGPDRAADGGGRREGGPAPARAAPSSSRPAATPASGWPWSPSSAATAASSSAPTRSARTSRTCCGRTGPRWWSARPRWRRRIRARYYNVSDRLAREIPGAWKPDQYSNPANPRSHYEETGPELWKQTGGPDHPLRGRRRHRRHDLRRRPLPQGAGRGPDHRRRPGGLGLLRRHRPAVPGRGRRRGLLAGRPTTGRSATRSSRCPTRTRSR